MDHRNRRSSILKVRQHVDIDIDETTVAGSGAPGASTTTMNRRVSFHNVKHVKQYDRDHGKLIDASPLREKITDTMDSDGILTPRGRNLDASEVAGNQTIHVFGNVNNANQTADMSLETVNENIGSETMQLFNFTREQTMVFEKTIKTTTVTERRVEGTVMDDTMALFNMTNTEEKDMTVDQTAFAVPVSRAARPNATVNQSVIMDLDESTIVPQANNDTMSLFNMSSVSVKDMDISNATVNETFKVPKSPSRSVMPRVFEENEDEVDMELTNVEGEKSIVANESMDISVMPAATPKKVNADQSDMVLEKTNLIQKTLPVLNESMDISVLQTESPKNFVGPNDTLALFQSPARQANRSYQHQEQPKNIVFRDQSVDMDITQTKPPAAAIKLNDSMDISEMPSEAHQSPARVQQSFVAPVSAPEPFDDNSMEVEEDVVREGTAQVIPTAEQTEMMVEEPSIVEQHEEERAMAAVSMMDVSGIQESLDYQQKLSTSIHVSPALDSSPQESEVHIMDDESSVSILKDTTIASNAESTISPQKTMQIETDMTATPREDESMQMEDVENQEKTFNEFVEQETMTMTMSFSSAKKSTSHLSRRRSLLRESVLESPRRVAIENSMITMNMAEMTALSEHRRRKSIQLNQQNLTNTSALNDSANMSKGRDIFALNTSVRSPHCSSTPRSGNVSAVAEIQIPAPESFQMPDFDPAVTNIVWLTSDNGDPIPEAEEFAKLVNAEKIKAEQENRMRLLDQNIDKEKAEAVRNGQWSKLSHDEKEVVLIARQDAEIRFLELRLAFAEKTREKYEKEEKELTEANARFAKQLEDVESMNALRQEIEELKSQPTEEDFERIEKEWQEAKNEIFKWKRAALQHNLDILLQMSEAKRQLEMEIEVREEKLAQLEAMETAEKEELMKIVATL